MTRQVLDRVLIHFERMPLREGQGCWAGDVANGMWIWLLKDRSEYGFLPPSSEVCNRDLLLLAEQLYYDGWDLGKWLTGVEQYVRENRELCPQARLFPVPEASYKSPAGCPVQGVAGLFEGGVVVHWASQFIGMPVCWVGRLDEAEGEFEWFGYDRNGVQVPPYVLGR